MNKKQLFYLITSIFCSLSIGFGLGLGLANSFFSFVILSLEKQIGVLILLMGGLGIIIYGLAFRKTGNRSDIITKPHLTIYWAAILIVLISMINSAFHQSGPFILWERKKLENIQITQGFAYQALTGHPEFIKQQLAGKTPARVLENGIPLFGGITDCQSKSLYEIGHGLICFSDAGVIFSASDNSDPRVITNLYEIIFPALFFHEHIYLLAFLSLIFVIVNRIFLADNKGKTNFLLGAFTASIPFLYLFPYIAPINNSFISVGNDFYIFYYDYKVYLLGFLSRLQIPLWSPAESAGFPFFISPFTQTFYPFNWVLAIYYRIAGGYTALDHHRFVVFGISIFALGLFYWLRQLNLNIRAVLFGALVMAVSFKVTEILRFPNAIHTAAWYPWILYAVTKIFQAQSYRQAWRYGLILIFSIVCLLTGGYPYYIFYSIFLFIPYLFLFFIPEIRKTVFGLDGVKLVRTLTVLISAGIAGIAICAPYLLKMASLMSQTTDRGGKSYEFSTSYQFNYLDTIGSLVFPPAAQLEGIYYFGAISVLLILFYILAGAKGIYSTLRSQNLNNERERRSSNRADIWLKVILVSWVGIISLITYGRESYLFEFLWYHMPIFSILRVWGRLGIILVPIFAWLLALAYQYFESIIISVKTDLSGSQSIIRLKSIGLLALCFGAVSFFQFYDLKKNVFDEYWLGIWVRGNIPAIWSKYFSNLNWLSAFFKSIADHYATMSANEILTTIGLIFIIFNVSAFLLLAILIAFSPKKLSSRQTQLAMWALLFIFSVANMAPLGPWLWTRGNVNLESPSQSNPKVTNMESFNVNRSLNPGIGQSSEFHVGAMPNWYYERYTTFLTAQEKDAPALNQLLGQVDGRKLYFSESINYTSPREYLQDAGRFQGFEKVVSYTGEKLIVNLSAPKAGFFSFIDNWDPDWTATIDGKPTKIELLFGTFKSVPLPPGDHQVIFEYRPVLFRP